MGAREKDKGLLILRLWNCSIFAQAFLRFASGAFSCSAQQRVATVLQRPGDRAAESEPGLGDLEQSLSQSLPLEVREGALQANHRFGYVSSDDGVPKPLTFTLEGAKNSLRLGATARLTTVLKALLKTLRADLNLAMGQYQSSSFSFFWTMPPAATYLARSSSRIHQADPGRISPISSS